MAPHGKPLLLRGWARDGGGVAAGAAAGCCPAAQPQADLWPPGGLAPIIVEAPGDVDAKTGPEHQSKLQNESTVPLHQQIIDLPTFQTSAVTCSTARELGSLWLILL